MAHIPLPTNLKIDAWHQLTHTQDDARVVEFLEFRFRIGYESPAPTPVISNHASAVSHQQDLTTYINKIKESAMLSTFEKTLFTPWWQVKAVLTIPMKDSNNWQVIMALSWPHAPRDTYLGTHHKMHLPSVQDLV